MGRWLICSLISVTVLAVGVTLKLSRSQNSSSVKTADRYWQETGLRAEALEDVVDDDSCRSSQRYFLACANAVAAVADRLGLRLTTDGTLVKAEARFVDLTERRFLEPWKTFFQEQPQLAAKFSFRKAWRSLVKEQIGPDREAAMTGAALNGFLSVFRDPHTYILPVDFYQEVLAKAKTSSLALGVVLARGKEFYFLRKIIDGSPAEKAGLLRGDHILSVNGIDLQSVPPQRLGDLLKGEDGAVTRFEVLRKGRKFSVEISRHETSMPSVTWKQLGGVRPMGVLTLHKFAHESCEETKQALIEMNKLRLKGLLLDLRDNSGGQMDEAACIVSLFVGPEKEAFRIKYLDPAKDPETMYGPEQKIWQGKVAILMNAGSASASEILAGSLRDHGRAILVGERTFGKGSFQEGEFWSRNHKIAFFETKGFYYLPSGYSPQLRGLEPDVAVGLGDSIPFREEDQYVNPLNPPILATRRSIRHLDLATCLDGDEFAPLAPDDLQLNKARVALFCGSLASGGSHGHL